jgi:hypothetical protein
MKGKPLVLNLIGIPLCLFTATILFFAGASYQARRVATIKQMPVADNLADGMGDILPRIPKGTSSIWLW